MASARHNITTDADFVDAMSYELIMRVSSVMSLADELLQGKHINDESYANIQAGGTTQNQMRELYRSLNNEESKAAFYKVLAENERFLVKELEEKYRSQDADVDEGVRKKPNENSSFSIIKKQHFDDPQTVDNETCTKLKEQWLNYNKYQTKFQELIEDPALKTMGNGKLFLCTEDKYKIGGPQTVDNETRTKLKEQWVERSKKYQTKFQELIADPDLKSMGNGKLFLCTKDKYKIGRGAAGTRVYIGMRDDGTEVAVKRMDRDDNKQLKDEMKVLRDPKLEHKNIVRYLDFTEDQDYVYLCLQLCEYDFEEYKETCKPDQDALKKVMKEVLLGLQVLHNARIIHRDLKPRNILIDVEGNARLADFGISRMINQDASTVHTSRVGTRGWEAAEILKGNADGTHGYKTSTDIQVAGMLMYYILSGGKHPFGTENEREENIRGKKCNLDETTDVEAKDLIEKMIADEPNARLSVKEAVEHPYFWDDEGRDAFLRKIGDMEQVQNYKAMDAELREAVGKYTTSLGWRSEITDFNKFEKNIPDDLLGLLRFLRNRLVHRKDIFYQNNMYKEVFPKFYISANQLAKEMKWK